MKMRDAFFVSRYYHGLILVMAFAAVIFALLHNITNIELLAILWRLPDVSSLFSLLASGVLTAGTLGRAFLVILDTGTPVGLLVNFLWIFPPLCMVHLLFRIFVQFAYPDKKPKLQWALGLGALACWGLVIVLCALAFWVGFTTYDPAYGLRFVHASAFACMILLLLHSTLSIAFFLVTANNCLTELGVLK
ncbi:MAG: hypothetical protein LBR25_00240 [Erysipelotrichaceae bacterium]|jgi:hypothetical protein|nr:hypothetical protein [Erysipelotrichaceae bacterium]